jgi:uncharacterized protein (DUF427 family)
MIGPSAVVPRLRTDRVGILELTPELRSAREKWRYRGETRPEFAVEPGPGQESVWDYPRPPRMQADARRVRVAYRGLALAETKAAVRVLETAGPPTFYIRPDDVNQTLLAPSRTTSLCEWKGLARGYDLEGHVADVAWAYAHTFPEFQTIAGWFAFYPAELECFVDDERVRPQPGGYYGGWITDEIVGPFKGAAGSQSWW